MRILALALVLLASPAFARDVTFTYTFAPEAVDCDGNAVDTSDYTAVEIYVDTIPIPASGGCSEPVDTVPGNAQVVQATPSGSSVVVDLAPGDYFARGRVQAFGLWSNLGPEVQVTVPEGRPQPIVIEINL